MKVLVAYDGSECADAAVVGLRRAGIPEDSDIHVITVVDSGAGSLASEVLDVSGQPAKPARTADLYEGHANAETAYRWIQSNFPGWNVSRQLLLGDPLEVILEKALAWCPDLLVIGSHGRSLAGRVFLGSVSEKLTQNASCSVRLVHAKSSASQGPIHIVVGSDGSDDSQHVVQEISRRTWPGNTEVRIVSVTDKIPNPRLEGSAKESQECIQRAGLNATAAVFEGDPKRELIAETERWSADAIFVGAHGLGRMTHQDEDHTLGSVSNSVLKHAHCAVEIVRTRAA